MARVKVQDWKRLWDQVKLNEVGGADAETKQFLNQLIASKHGGSMLGASSYLRSLASRHGTPVDTELREGGLSKLKQELSATVLWRDWGYSTRVQVSARAQDSIYIPYTGEPRPPTHGIGSPHYKDPDKLPSKKDQFGSWNTDWEFFDQAQQKYPNIYGSPKLPKIVNFPIKKKQRRQMVCPQ